LSRTTPVLAFAHIVRFRGLAASNSINHQGAKKNSFIPVEFAATAAAQTPVSITPELKSGSVIAYAKLNGIA
jgi:hypothetical protein